VSEYETAHIFSKGSTAVRQKWCLRNN